MKKKKKKVLKTVISTALVGLCLVGVTSCEDKKDDNNGQVETQKFTVTFNVDGGSTINNQIVEDGKKATKPSDPKKDGYTFSGWYKDSGKTKDFKFDTEIITANTTIYAKWTANAPVVTKYDVTFDVDGGTPVAAQSVESGKKVSKPDDPTKVDHTFAGWYKDSAKTVEFNFTTETITAKTTIYAKWTENTTSIPDGHERVVNSLDFSKFSTGTLGEDTVLGKFTISKGTPAESRTGTATDGTKFPLGICLKMGAANTLTVQVDGPGKLVMYLGNGSSSYGTQTDGEAPLMVSKDGGEEVEHKFSTTGSSGPIVRFEMDVEQGTYVIHGKATIRVYSVETDCIVESGLETGFEIASKGIVDYLIGSKFDASKLQVNATFSTGKTEVISSNDLTIDSSSFDENTSGEYEIKVSYKNYDVSTYKVYVYSVEEINFTDFTLSSSVSNKWGNGVLSTNTLKTIYEKGDSLDINNLSVFAIAKCGELTKTFKLDNTQYQVNPENFKNDTAGTYSILINAYDKQADFEVSVVDTTVSMVDGVAQVKVDLDYEGVIGAVVDNYNVFTTIESALQYLENADLDASVKKQLFVAKGVYNEKIDVTIPNLTLIGESAKETIITFDAANGKTDANGTPYSTDGSATFAVRQTAEDFTAISITFENYYNTLERYNALKEVTSGTQAEAVIVQADRASFYNCIMTGFQDTLQLQGAGRQYFNNCLIVGATDYIFGTNSSALFEKCEIRTIGNGQSDNGGYITATKGNNKGGDATIFGYIFNDCDFTSDAQTPVGKTAIARPWNSNSTITVMNSRLGKHISKEAYTTGSTKGTRYVDMSGLAPTATGVKYSEYNNTGEGAITEEILGMKMLTQEVADKMLEDFFKGYTMPATDSKYSFTFTDWTVTAPTIKDEDKLVLPEEIEQPEEPVIKETGIVDTIWYFDGKTTPNVDNNEYQITNGYQNSTGNESGLIIDATAGKFAPRDGNVAQFNLGATMSFNVKAGAVIEVKTYSIGAVSINGVVSTDKVFSQTISEDGLVTIKAEANDYIYYIKVTYPVVDKEYGTVDTTWFFNNTEAVEANNEYTYSDPTQYQPGGTTTLEWNGLSVDATVGKFAYNSNGYVQVNTGTKISFAVKSGAVVTITSFAGQGSYNINGGTENTKKEDVYSVNVETDGTFEIIPFATSYLYSIVVTYPKA